MRSPRRIVFLIGVLGSCVLVAYAQSPNRNPELDLGVQAYKNAKYEEAIFHFEKAVANEPANVTAHMYLATAYAQNFIPGVDTPDNLRSGQAAITQYKQLLVLDSSNANATKAIAYLYLQMKKFDLAKQYYRKASKIDPNDPENYYSMGVIEWTQTYQPRMETRAKLELKPEQSMINHTECWRVRDLNQERVADGIEMLKKAIERRPEYDDAMAYMNLMYRERADIQCGDSKASDADLKTADEWVDLTLAVKKRKAGKKERKSAVPNEKP
jgi:tetratricopeptide (TPR) repeat protein